MIEHATEELVASLGKALGVRLYTTDQVKQELVKATRLYLVSEQKDHAARDIALTLGMAYQLYFEDLEKKGKAD